MIKKTFSIIAASMIVSASCELPKTILIPSDKLNDLDYISNKIDKTFDKKIIQDIKRITENCNMGVESSINKL